MQMFRRPIWLFYALFATFVAVVTGVGLAWWMGVIFAVVFAALAVLAWITMHTRERTP